MLSSEAEGKHSAGLFGSGESNSELRGQIGIQCVENDRIWWEAELRDMEEAYDPIISEVRLLQPMNLRIGGAS